MSKQKNRERTMFDKGELAGSMARESQRSERERWFNELALVRTAMDTSADLSQLLHESAFDENDHVATGVSHVVWRRAASLLDSVIARLAPELHEAEKAGIHQPITKEKQ